MGGEYWQPSSDTLQTAAEGSVEMRGLRRGALPAQALCLGPVNRIHRQTGAFSSPREKQGPHR